VGGRGKGEERKRHHVNCPYTFVPHCSCAPSEKLDREIKQQLEFSLFGAVFIVEAE